MSVGAAAFTFLIVSPDPDLIATVGARHQDVEIAMLRHQSPVLRRGRDGDEMGKEIVP